MSEARNASVRRRVLVVMALMGSATTFAQTAEKAVLHQGEVTGDNVYVRSGPSLNHYTVSKLRKGERIQVVGEAGEWLEILPPAGAFSLISGDYLDTADNKSGVVNAENVRVRAGSQLNDNKYTVQTVLTKGASVEILERAADGFVRIKPPMGATLWVSKAFVNTAPGTASAATDGASAQPDATKPVDVAAPTSADLEKAPPAMKEYDDAKAKETAERKADSGAVPSSTGTASADALRADASSSSSVSNRKRLEELDGEVRIELTKPLAERELRPFMERYQRIAETDSDTVNKQYADARVEHLRGMMAVLTSIRSLHGTDEKTEAIRQEYLRQRAGLPQYVRTKEPVSLDEKGVLRVSALYPLDSEPKRLRLLDHAAAADRTLGYVEIPTGSSIDVQRFIGAYVGVRASSKRWQDGSVNPVPIYVASELVLLDAETGEAVAPETPGSTDESSEPTTTGEK